MIEKNGYRPVDEITYLFVMVCKSKKSRDQITLLFYDNWSIVRMEQFL